MKIVAANYADSLRRSDGRDTVEAGVVESVRVELLAFYGSADHDVPEELTALARRLDGADTARGATA
ncbi:hypothetical protein [Methylobacterium sp. P5_C11]|jgi:hypothetical protein